jgi:hypothetical protein
VKAKDAYPRFVTTNIYNVPRPKGAFQILAVAHGHDVALYRSCMRLLATCPATISLGDRRTAITPPPAETRS